MGQEFIIKSPDIEDKINQLLPSQGGFGAGVDISASTTVIPIVDLTQTAEGSLLRQDLQTSLALTSSTAHNLTNTSTTIINTTGYFRVTGNFCTVSVSGSNKSGTWDITDGTTTKRLFNYRVYANSNTQNVVVPYDFIVFVQAGDSLIGVVDADAALIGSSRQIADINGNLVNPT